MDKNYVDFGYGTNFGDAAELSAISKDVSEVNQVLSLAGIAIPGLGSLSQGLSLANAAVNNPCAKSNKTGFLASKLLSVAMSATGVPVALFSSLGVVPALQCKAGRKNVSDVLASVLNKFAGGNTDTFMGICSNDWLDPVGCVTKQQDANNFVILEGAQSGGAIERRRSAAYNIMAALLAGYSIQMAVRNSVYEMQTGPVPGLSVMDYSVVASGKMTQMSLPDALDLYVDNFENYHDVNGNLTWVNTQSQPASTADQRDYNKFTIIKAALDAFYTDHEPAGTPYMYSGEDGLLFITSTFLTHTLKSFIQIKDPVAYSKSSAQFQALSTGNEINPDADSAVMATTSSTTKILPLAMIATGALMALRAHK